jgi:hypothetical protein
MNDTDRLIASNYATAMIGTRTNAKNEDFWAFYDMALEELQRRETAEGKAATDAHLMTLEKLAGR